MDDLIAACFVPFPSWFSYPLSPFFLLFSFCFLSQFLFSAAAPEVAAKSWKILFSLAHSASFSCAAVVTMHFLPPELLADSVSTVIIFLLPLFFFPSNFHFSSKKETNSVYSSFAGLILIVSLIFCKHSYIHVNFSLAVAAYFP